MHRLLECLHRLRAGAPMPRTEGDWLQFAADEGITVTYLPLPPHLAGCHDGTEVYVRDTCDDELRTAALVHEVSEVLMSRYTSMSPADIHRLARRAQDLPHIDRPRAWPVAWVPVAGDTVD